MTVFLPFPRTFFLLSFLFLFSLKDPRVPDKVTWTRELGDFR